MKRQYKDVVVFGVILLAAIMFYIGIWIGRIWQLDTGYMVCSPDSVVVADHNMKCPICGKPLESIQIKRNGDPWGTVIYMCNHQGAE